LSSRSYTFEQKVITDPSTRINGTYDIVSCQFTLHYFFETDDMLETVVNKVSAALKPDGYFIGTTMIGSKVKELVKNNKFKDKIQIHEVDADTYKMKLLDTAQIYDRDLDEYYVNFDKFKKLCEARGLVLKESKPFSEKYKAYLSKNKKNPLKDFELAVSNLNVTFIFQKR